MPENNHGHQPDEQQHDSAHGYETRDVSMSVVWVGVGSMVVVIAVCMVLMVALLKAFMAAPRPVAKDKPIINYGRLLPPEPRLQPTPPRDLAEFRESEERFLHSYGWINKEEGVVRIPIERAIELVATRGIPAWLPAEEEAIPQASSESAELEATNAQQ